MMLASSADSGCSSAIAVDFVWACQADNKNIGVARTKIESSDVARPM